MLQRRDLDAAEQCEGTKARSSLAVNLESLVGTHFAHEITLQLRRMRRRDRRVLRQRQSFFEYRKL
jgi:hypothetical protein